jgi:DNA-binding transcriptional LysR family regulator
VLRAGYNPPRRQSIYDPGSQVARIGNRGEMEAFVRSVERGSFSAAARELKLTPSALSKLVTRLERSLQVRLITRTTRKLELTPEGELFLARCRRILAEMEDAETEIGRARERPRGRLRMHVNVGFAVHQVVPAIPRFVKRYPDVQIELVVEDRQVDVVREGIDISVRPGAQTDPAMVARKICDYERIVCASPEYLSKHGRPSSPEDLARHHCITVSSVPGRSNWAFQKPAGRMDVEVPPGTSANNADCVLRFALMGIGIVRLNEFIVAAAMREGRLVQVLPDYHYPEALSMVALYPQERHRLPRVAAMLDFLVHSFAAAPWRNAAGPPTGKASR